jgi:hypothetical protein
MVTDDLNALRLRQDGNASDIILHRVSNRPNTCNTPPHNTPPSNYAIFWQTFAEQYAFFAIHKMDWNAVDKIFRPQVTASTTLFELFQIFCQMIESLHDAHTGISAHDLKQWFGGYRDDPYHLDDARWTKAASLIESKYVHDGLRPFCKGSLQFGSVGDSLGYFRITNFSDYADPGGYANALQCLEQTLDAIFTGAPLRGLIIDVRLNRGGDDPLGIAIAARLTDKKYLAYTKVTRNSLDLNAPLRYTEPQPSWVLPSARPGFKGKVILLTGPDTVCAGETFTMALFGRQPLVTRIGRNTQGVFSDVLGRSLPNGWHFRLPNEIYFTVDGKAFDGSGIPPDISVPFFSASDLQAGTDRALESAIDQFPKFLADSWASSAGELHPRALSAPGVNFSAHTTPAVEPPACQ